MEYFLEKHAGESRSKHSQAWARKKMEMLESHDWPGNIRELGNLARKLVALGESKAAMAN